MSFCRRVLLTALLTASSALPAAGMKSATLAVTSDGSRLVVANPDSGTVSVLSTAPLSLLAEVAVGARPRALAVTPDNRGALVTSGGKDEVIRVDLSELAVTARVKVGAAPYGLVVGPGGRVYVACEGEGTLASLIPSGDSGYEVEAVVPTEDRPRGLALAEDGTTLYLTHFTTGRVSIIDLPELRIASVIATGADSNVAQAIAVDAEGRRGYLPHTRSNSTNPAPLFDTTLFPVVSVVDLAEGRHLAAERLALDLLDRPASLPLDALLGPDGSLFVVNGGSDDLVAIDPAQRSLIARLEVPGFPAGLALAPDGRTLYVHSLLAGSVTSVEVPLLRRLTTVSVTESPLPPEVLRGKILFHSSAAPQIARDRWIACAGCHFEGGADGRTWAFPDGPRNTPSLLGVAETLPLHWSGNLDELEDVEVTVRGIQGGSGLVPGGDGCAPACDQGPPNRGRSQALDDLGVFLRSLEMPVGEAEGPGGTLPAAAARGRALFMATTTGCTECHPPPLYTDRRRHDVGTGSGSGERQGPEMDTPSLRGVAATPPYLHDGSASTLLDVLTDDGGGRHGHTASLSEDQLRDLTAFLEALPFEETGCGEGALCLFGGRLRVEARWQDPRTGAAGTGRPMLLSRNAGAFWFFSADNLELAVKLVDGTAINSRWWLFVGALTDLEAEVTITDTSTGERRRYPKRAGDYCGAVDLGSFALPPGPGSPASHGWPPSRGQASTATLRLAEGRFEAHLDWHNPRDGRSGAAFSLPASDRTGAFYFASPSNPEVLIKVLDGASRTGSPWIFAGTLTDLELRLTVTDTATGASETYHRPPRQRCGFADLRAFDDP